MLYIKAVTETLQICTSAELKGVDVVQIPLKATSSADMLQLNVSIERKIRQWLLCKVSRIGSHSLRSCECMKSDQ